MKFNKEHKLIILIQSDSYLNNILMSTTVTLGTRYYNDSIYYKQKLDMFILLGWYILE